MIRRVLPTRAWLYGHVVSTNPGLSHGEPDKAITASSESGGATVQWRNDASTPANLILRPCLSLIIRSPPRSRCGRLSSSRRPDVDPRCADCSRLTSVRYRTCVIQGEALGAILPFCLAKHTVPTQHRSPLSLDLPGGSTSLPLCYTSLAACIQASVKQPRVRAPQQDIQASLLARRTPPRV